MTLEKIINFLQIDEFTATAGQPSLDQFGLLKQSGYKIVINLAMPDSTDALPQERRLVEDLGLLYIHIPVVWEEPKLEDFETFSRVMNEHQGKKIFVHCARNMRVSVFVYLYYLFNRDVCPDVFYQNVLRIWEPNPVWQQFMQKVFEAHQIV